MAWEEYLKRDHVFPNRVPRPFERWLSQIFYVWEHKDIKADWYEKVKQLANEYGCKLIVDPNQHWIRSFYTPGWDEEKAKFCEDNPTILAGGKGRSAYVCTVILHELGHRILDSQNQISPYDYMAEEEEAWIIAQKIASENALPLVSKMKRKALYSYKYRQQLEEFPGSKRKSKRPAKKNIDNLLRSKRTSKMSTPLQEYPLGKKGKRKVKKELKKITHRSERREKESF